MDPSIKTTKIPKFKIRAPFTQFNLTQIILIITLLIPNSNSNSIPYNQHCNIPQETIPTKTQFTKTPNFLKLDKAQFTLGFQNPNSQFSNQFASFSVQKAYETNSKDVIHIEGVLNLVGPEIVSYFSGEVFRRGLRLVKVRPPRYLPRQDVGAGFRLFGFWDSGSGEVCMVGSGSGSLLESVEVVFKMSYPNSSVLDTSLVNGTLESLKLDHGFKPVSVLGFTRFGYKFSYISKEVENGGFSGYDGVENRTLSPPNGICSVLTWGLRFELDYSEYDCTNVSCSFGTMEDEIFPRFMSIKVVDCLEDGKVRYVLQFTNSSYVRGWSVNPYTSLVAEGVWDEKKKRLMLVACKLFDRRGVGGCSIRLALSLPSRLSLRHRSSIVGKMWSTETRDLGNVSFNSPANLNSRIKGTTYEYLENEKVGNLCQKILDSKVKKGIYRDEIFTNLRFDMLVKNRKGQMAYGYASPLYIGDKFYNPFGSIKSSQWNLSNGYINISYVISFTTRGEFEFGGKVPASKMVEISAEGMYNTKNGVICMIGCRHMPYEKFQRNRSLDCELVINIKYPPLHGQDGEMVYGTIKSTRKKPDPLYFEPLEFSSSSITTLQARESIWRMDLEITMVLVSNTLACIFIGLQLFHVKRNPEIVPLISIVMLVVLTLGYMIPLLLNFEAIFIANRKQNVFLGTDQWLEVNEVLVRVITMVAFLLQFRLLQLTWSSRKGHESQNNLWISDKKVLYLAIPLYIAFGLTALIAHSLQNSHTKTQQFHSRVLVSQNVTFWGELKSYVGLVLDAYLIPQIMFNLFYDTHGTVLTPLFYVGSTMVRLLPHVYDLYRTHSSSWVYDKIYANPGMDYYSTMWDVVICFGGLICVVVIYIQQRFGGRSVMPKRFRDSVLYQKVPVIIIPEQQIF